ncbi:LmbE family N-acetylglucosaminyl deacetylase [Tamaricihabitans halophyticus]|uniref:LmbE family N-acetylglucosaminyl deacetylase n=1 Tax=Tamaricihabitans halophyticus TaxID=1262583 RepID=A0A4R2QM46_9PSEU|nr:PIG-L deacetylase family protein [Tamaricihabitans halophyticus]TCP49949.1 LmbE family N-acetylglucosaminyl deacetylase [Tamaricihabitans halophyticus]
MPALRPFPTSWTRAVCVLPHPDDMEYGPAAAAALWVQQGKQLSYVLITSGEAGIDGTAPETAGALREAEEVAAARQVGVEDLEFLRFPDSAIEDTAELRTAIANAVRPREPELIVLLNHHDRWAYGGANTSDHMRAGQAVLGCVAEYSFPRLRWIGIADSPRIDHAVDVTDTMDRGLAALREHRAYLAALGGEQWSVDHVLGNARQAGRMFGTRYAAAFELREHRAGQ